MVQEVKMINTYLLFEDKIHYGSKFIAFSRNYTKFFFKFQGQFDIEGEDQGHQFSNSFEIIRWSMNSLNVNKKFQIGQYKSLKQNILQVCRPIWPWRSSSTSQVF